MKPDRKAQVITRPGLAALGWALVAASCAASGFEAWRNFSYGMQTGFVYAGAYLLFAIGLILTQLAARYRGWLEMAPAALICAAMTFWYGFNYYADDIRTAIQTAEHGIARAAAGEADIAAADVEIAAFTTRLAAISEQATSASLRAARDEAAARAAKEATKERGGCGARADSLCKKAEREAAEYNRRLIDAEGREDLERKLEAARKRRGEGRAATEVVQQKGAGAAFVLSWVFGWPEATIRRYAGTIEPIAMIAGQLFLAALFTPGLALIARSKGQPEKPVEPTPVADVPQAAPAPQPAPTGRKPMSPEARMRQFVREKLRPGQGEATATQVSKAFEEWRKAKCPDLPKPGPKALAEALAAAKIGREKRGGVIRYSAKIDGSPSCSVPAKRGRKSAAVIRLVPSTGSR